MTTSEYLQVFEAYRMYIFYFCKKWLDHQENAEDITSEVFIKLWKNIDKVEAHKAKAYLLVTANHKCQDKIKTDKKYAAKIQGYSLADLDEVEIDTEVLTYLHKVITTLNPQERRMILLAYKDGRQVKEIAKLLELSPQTVSNTLHTAIKKLRHAVKKQKAQ